MTDSLPQKALLGAPEPEKPVPAEALVTVAKTFGVSPLNQFFHQFWRILGPKKTKLFSICSTHHLTCCRRGRGAGGRQAVRVEAGYGLQMNDSTQGSLTGYRKSYPASSEVSWTRTRTRPQIYGDQLS